MLVRQKEATPKVIIHQERGDILYVPSWWRSTLEASPAVSHDVISL